MKQRLVKRNQNTKDEIQKRYKSFDEDVKHWSDYDYIVINKNLHNCFEQIEKIKAKLSHLDIYTYDSDHGFNCNHRGSYDENSADLALSRTLTFFADKLGS